MAAGIPTIVTAGTWLARQQPLGTGETFADPAGFEQAVRKLLANYPFYLAPAQQFRLEWLRRHTPDNLIDALVGSTSRTYISVSTA
jgi:hypothetical protein